MIDRLTTTSVVWICSKKKNSTWSKATYSHPCRERPRLIRSSCWQVLVDKQLSTTFRQAAVKKNKTSSYRQQTNKQLPIATLQATNAQQAAIYKNTYLHQKFTNQAAIECAAMGLRSSIAHQQQQQQQHRQPVRTPRASLELSQAKLSNVIRNVSRAQD